MLYEILSLWRISSICKPTGHLCACSKANETIKNKQINKQANKTFLSYMFAPNILKK